MNKICTSIEQSKHLLELGLDPETADMWYTLSEDEELKILSINKETLRGNKFVPAWSLSALLDLIPHTMFTGIKFDLNNYSDNLNVWTASYSEKDSETGIIRLKATPIDAIYEIVVWLLKNKKL